MPARNTTPSPVRWNIFAGIVFSVLGMCLLNYYALFPEADKRDAEKYDKNGNNPDEDEKYLLI